MLSFEFTPWHWVIAIIAAYTIGLSKTGFAGVGLVGIYLMTEIMPARESTGVILPMVVFADLVVIRSYYKLARWPLIRAFLPWALIGILAGYFLFLRIPEDRFRTVVGTIILVLVAGQYLRRWLVPKPSPGPPPRLAGIGLGLVGGINTMIANSAGPFMAMYLLMDATLDKWGFVGTNAMMFVIINCSKLPLSYSLGVITPKSLLFNLYLAPAVLLGIATGRFVLERISQRAFEEILLLFCLLAALRLIWS
jgi:uncharacterized membrane protein YfcA